MTIRQRILRWFYPLVMSASKKPGHNAAEKGAGALHPPQPFHQLQAQLNNGQTFSFADAKNKKILLVNTASNCGYTAQYSELQQLQEKYGDKLLVIGFPANDFKEQEKGNDEEIAQFCQVNFGVSFPLAKKSTVVKSDDQHPVFRWLSSAEQNGWNDKAPEWNFSKYLVNETGVLTHYFPPGTSPMSAEVQEAIKR